MEAKYSSETSVDSQWAARRYIAEDRTLQRVRKPDNARRTDNFEKILGRVTRTIRKHIPYYISISWGGARLSLLGTLATIGLLYQSR
jgi:hypothetical protein